MRGIILTVDRRNGRGLLRAEDGRRYGFDLADWRDDVRPAKGDEVDFELHGGVPRELLVLNAAESGEGASQLAALAQRIRERPILIWAGALFLASLLPAYGFGGSAGSLFAVQSHISALAGEIDRLWAAAGAGPDIATRVGIAKLLLAILPATLAAPLLACLVFWRTLNEQDDRPLARITGLAAAILTAGLPLLYGFCAWLLLSGELGRGAREILSGGPFAIAGFGMLRFIDIGTVAVSVSGFMLWRAAGGGRLIPQPRATVPRNEDPSAFAPAATARQMKNNPEVEGDDPIPEQFRRNARVRVHAGGNAANTTAVDDGTPHSAVTETLPAHMLPPEPRGPGSIGAGAIPWPPPEGDAMDQADLPEEAAPREDIPPPEPVPPAPPRQPRPANVQPPRRPAAPAPRAVTERPQEPESLGQAESRRQRDDRELSEPHIRRAAPSASDAEPQRPQERAGAPVRPRERPASPEPSPPREAATAGRPVTAQKPGAAPISEQPAKPVGQPGPAAGKQSKKPEKVPPPVEPPVQEAPPAPPVQESNESVQRLYERLRAERLLRMSVDRDDG
ncbi:MAG: hypothetical protein KDJ53_11965 [Rhodobiaceae bacterium]|nr:hypothetical protein [Rhodobiaceae bacterium]